ncbi:hypothetical protein OSB04_023055 [Centaurea solstitialis]|uniref:Rapid alkalinization factor-like n=1 Tax=Centaurea solstitialis TaxID=347529 RepID=A0AA38SQX4_9ASTR|nr:hypothetical protein OSB04_023055 [Centaurea solstitialis]
MAVSVSVSTNSLLLLLISAFVLLLPAAAVAGGSELSWLPTHGGGGKCSGSMAECIGEMEMEMESESTRRILATTSYISYGALQGNNVPCSQRGASYYNCRSGGQANPYQRGCSTITRCRR